MNPKKLFTPLFSFAFSVALFAQDKMFRHNGKTGDVKIIRVAEFTIVYTYPNETAEQTIGKYAVVCESCLFMLFNLSLNNFSNFKLSAFSNIFIQNFYNHDRRIGN
jgi:hypothetical protein